jgi:predicted RNA binding protein YcfA (HicA-like mRNA interferase family)
MQKTPVLSGWEAVKVFQRFGWQIIKGTGKGSHIILVREGHIATFQFLTTGKSPEERSDPS